MKFIVQLNHDGNNFFLRGTVWTSEMSRASIFETREAAQSGLDKAKQFMKAKQYKAATIIQSA